MKIVGLRSGNMKRKINSDSDLGPKIGDVNCTPSKSLKKEHLGIYPPKLRDTQNQTRVKPKISLFEDKIRESSKSAVSLVPDNGPTVDLTIANDRSEIE